MGPISRQRSASLMTEHVESGWFVPLKWNLTFQKRFGLDYGVE